ncbi:ADP-ribosylglycohydrolase family protein [Pendulispora rubella]|uniref:ADP-ribosylglycohydrolase family protein n=1 Tax=Pendulispora rubella TaxID=2741070 RepID=A0ABZ2LE99_9BACT
MGRIQRELPADHAARLRRAEASLDGLSVGDAFGERFVGDVDVVRARIASRTLPRPTWDTTDETELAFAIIQVLDRYGRIDQDALADRFADRYQADPARGYGATVHGVLRAIGEGMPWRRVVREPFEGLGSMGNGAASRAGVVGAYFADDLEKVVAEARASAEVTHAHAEGQAGAIAVAVAAATAWRMRRAPQRAQLFETVLRHTPESDTARRIAQASQLAPTASVDFAARKLGNGSQTLSVDTVPLALFCAARHLDDYVEAMWSTVSALGDRDTLCAIVGSIVALCAPPIPANWLLCREPIGDRVPDSYHLTLVTGRSTPPAED